MLRSPMGRYVKVCEDDLAGAHVSDCNIKCNVRRRSRYCMCIDVCRSRSISISGSNSHHAGCYCNNIPAASPSVGEILDQRSLIERLVVFSHYLRARQASASQSKDRSFVAFIIAVCINNIF